MNKIVYRVSAVPSGRYRSFERRGWPTGHWLTDQGPVAVRFECEDEYKPRNVKTGNHKPISIYIAEWIPEEERGDRAAFYWRRLKVQAATLKEAKDRAAGALKVRPEFWPTEDRF